MEKSIWHTLDFPRTNRAEEWSHSLWTRTRILSSTTSSTNPLHFFPISKAANSTPGDKRSLLTCTACTGVFPNLFICQMSLVFTEEFLLISRSHSTPQRCTCHRVNKQGGGQNSWLPPSQTRGSSMSITLPSTPWHFSVCRLVDGWIEVPGDRNGSGIHSGTEDMAPCASCPTFNVSSSPWLQVGIKGNVELGLFSYWFLFGFGKRVNQTNKLQFLFNFFNSLITNTSSKTDPGSEYPS